MSEGEPRSTVGPTIGIAIATYKRSTQLDALLAAIPTATAPFDGLRLAISDNDPARSAEEVARAFAQASSLDVRYTCISEPGISSTRNGALALLTECDFVVFIDDDEIPQIGWLAALMDVQRRYQADVVVGPVEAISERPAPSKLITRAAHEFANPRLPEGANLKWCATNNTLISQRCIESVPEGFSVGYGLTGGEDLHYFRRATLAGMKIVWTPDARVIEPVTAERESARWLLRRAFQSGMLQGKVERDLERPNVWLERLARGGANMAKGAVVALLAAVRRSWGDAFVGCQRIALGIGMIVGILGVSFTSYGASTTD